MKVAIGSDHAGFEYKQLLVEMLSKEGYEVIDVGPTTGERTDYPDYAVAASTKVAQGEADAGV